MISAHPLSFIIAQGDLNRGCKGFDHPPGGGTAVRFCPPPPIFMKTEDVIQAVMSAFPRMSELREHPERMNSFDYESDDYLVEVKVRRKDYDPWIIEELKVDTNIAVAESVKKDFLYVNCFPPKIYIWNISKMIREDYDFGYEKRGMPHTTDFGGRGMVTKSTGYLYNKTALIVDISDLSIKIPTNE